MSVVVPDIYNRVSSVDRVRISVVVHRTFAFSIDKYRRPFNATLVHIYFLIGLTKTRIVLWQPVSTPICADKDLSIPELRLLHALCADL